MSERAGSGSDISAGDSGEQPASRIFFRYNGVDSNYGRLAYIDFSRPAEVHFAGALQCEVVHVSGGRGICLRADRGVFTSYAASLFDAGTFAITSRFPLKGIPD